jgi:hypothetical protein
MSLYFPLEPGVQPVRELRRGEWVRFCDGVSRALVGKVAEIDIVSLQLGDRVEARWLPLRGITYEPKTDAIEVAVDGVAHLIREPREIHLDETERGLVEVIVIAADESRQSVRLREPLYMEESSL